MCYTILGEFFKILKLTVFFYHFFKIKVNLRPLIKNQWCADSKFVLKNLPKRNSFAAPGA